MRIRNPRNYLIKTGIQLGMTYRFLFLIILFTIFISFEAYITVWPVVSAYIPKELLSLVKYQILIRALFFVFPVIIVITLSVIIFSHRIAGPLYNIEQNLKKLIQGEKINSIRLRKGDELKELAEIINKILPAVNRINEIKKKDAIDNP